MIVVVLVMLMRMFVVMPMIVRMIMVVMMPGFVVIVSARLHTTISRAARRFGRFAA